MFGLKKKEKNKIHHTEPVHSPVSVTDGSSRRIVSEPEVDPDSSNEINLIDVNRKPEATEVKANAMQDEIEDLDAISDVLEDRKATIGEKGKKGKKLNLKKNKKNKKDKKPDRANDTEEAGNAGSKKKAKVDFTKAKAVITALKAKYLGDITSKDVLAAINPQTPRGVDVLTDYIMRVLIFLFPLYIYENTFFMSITGKDVLFGIVILVMTLWCIIRAIKTDVFKNASGDPGSLAIIGTFVLIIIAFATQVSNLASEMAHSYLYIGCFLIAFASMFIGKCSRYYLQLFTAAISLVLISAYKYIFTANATLLGSENLLSKSTKFVPLLMLACAVTAVLYLTEKKTRFEKLYLVILAAAEVLLFLYGNMVSFVIMFLFFMGLQFINEPTMRFIKKNLILLFLFGFCASNAPLLTYFKTPGLKKSFDLEYSIYIDIIIAVLGLIVTGYWDRLPKDKDEDSVLLSILSGLYRKTLAVIVVVLAIFFVFGSRGAKLSNAFGGKAISGLSTGLWDSISGSSGELWHVMAKYGLLGLALMLILGIIIFRKIAAMWAKGNLDEITKGYLAIAVMFLVQSFFFPYAATSTPVFMVFVGLAIASGAGSKEAPAAEEEVAAEVVETTSLKAEMPLAGKVLAKGRFSSFVRNAMDQVDKDLTQSKDLKGIFKLKGYVNILAYATVSAMVAGFILLAVVGICRLTSPITPNGAEVESLVEVAMLHHQEELLAAAAEASNGELDAAASDSASALGSTEDTLLAGSEASVVTAPEEPATAATSIELASNEASSEQSALESQEVPDIQAGISGGNYRIYDPNAAYTEVNEEVRGKNGAVNLRNMPSLEEGVEIVHRLAEDEKVVRIGIGENGWSKLMYGDQVVYGVSEYLTNEEPAEEDEEAEEAEEDEEAEEVEEAPEAATEPPEEAKEAPAMPKGAANYTVYVAPDKKSVSIWSAGKQYGTMTVTGEDGKVQELTHDGIFTSGTGKNEKRYLRISSTNPTQPLTINVDDGFIQAIRNMGYSGVYLNKTVNNW